MTQPPRRLADDPEAPQALREDLARTAGSSARVFDEGSGAARFQAWVTGAGASAGGGGAGGVAGGVGAGAGDGAALAPSAKAAVGAVAKWSVVAAVGVVCVAAAALVVRAPRAASRGSDAPTSHASSERAAPPAPRSPTSSAVPGASPPGHPIAPSPVPAPMGPAALVAQPASPPEARAHAPLPGSTAAPVVDPDAALRREIAALGEARAALASNPARALELATRGQAEFRAGMFREEREAIAVFALGRLGRDSEARRRAEVFIARYPDGPFSEQIRRLSAGARPQ